MTRLLFDAPWWLPTVLAFLGIALFWNGNRRGETKLRNAGLLLLLGAVAVLAVSHFVDTDIEKAEKQSKQLVYAVEQRDWATLKTILDPNTSLHVLGGIQLYDSRDEIIAAAKKAVDQHGLKNVPHPHHDVGADRHGHQHHDVDNERPGRHRRADDHDDVAIRVATERENVVAGADHEHQDREHAGGRSGTAVSEIAMTRSSLPGTWTEGAERVRCLDVRARSKIHCMPALVDHRQLPDPHLPPGTRRAQQIVPVVANCEHDSTTPRDLYFGLRCTCVD